MSDVSTTVVLHQGSVGGTWYSSTVKFKYNEIKEIVIYFFSILVGQMTHDPVHTSATHNVI